MSLTDLSFPRTPDAAGIKNTNIIPVHMLGKIIWLEAHEITYLQGDGNYTHIYTRRGKHYLVSKNLKTIQDMLDAGFLRVHKSYTINPYHLVGRIDVDMLLLSCGKKIPIARRRIRETQEMLAGE